MRPLAACTVVALAAACATTPAPNPQLEEARAAYRAAQSDPHVPALAPSELDAAGRSLNQAEALWREDAHPGIVSHHAYLAVQMARIARETASKRAAEEELEQAAKERERAELEAQARESEALAREKEALAQEQAREAERLRAEVERLEAQVAQLDARPTERGWVVTIGSDVLFDVGRATLKPGSRRALEQLASLLRQHPERRLMIEGFTDSTGSDELNQRLSERRAQAVRDALVRGGVSRQRLETRGLGAAFPVASNDTAAGRQLNRRVEVVISGEEPRAATGASR